MPISTDHPAFQAILQSQEYAGLSPDKRMRILALAAKITPEAATELSMGLTPLNHSQKGSAPTASAGGSASLFDPSLKALLLSKQYQQAAPALRKALLDAYQKASPEERNAFVYGDATTEGLNVPQEKSTQELVGIASKAAPGILKSNVVQGGKAGAAMGISAAAGTAGYAAGSAIPGIGPVAGPLLEAGALYGARRLNQSLGLEQGTPTLMPQDSTDLLTIGAPLALRAVGAVAKSFTKPGQQAIQAADEANLARQQTYQQDLERVGEANRGERLQGRASPGVQPMIDDVQTARLQAGDKAAEVRDAYVKQHQSAQDTASLTRQEQTATYQQASTAYDNALTRHAEASVDLPALAQPYRPTTPSADLFTQGKRSEGVTARLREVALDAYGNLFTPGKGVRIDEAGITSIDKQAIREGFAALKDTAGFRKAMTPEEIAGLEAALNKHLTALPAMGPFPRLPGMVEPNLPPQPSAVKVELPASLRLRHADPTHPNMAEPINPASIPAPTYQEPRVAPFDWRKSLGTAWAAGKVGALTGSAGVAAGLGPQGALIVAGGAALAHAGMSPVISRAILAREGGEAFLRQIIAGEVGITPQTLGAFLGGVRTGAALPDALATDPHFQVITQTEAYKGLAPERQGLFRKKFSNLTPQQRKQLADEIKE